MHTHTHTHNPPVVPWTHHICRLQSRANSLMCTEQNSRCVLYNHSRGKEGRVKEDYCQNFPAFLLSARVSTFSRLPCQTGSLPVSPPLFPLSSKTPRIRRGLACRLQENVGHLFFCSSLHFNRKTETGAITSFSAFVSPHLLLLLLYPPPPLPPLFGWDTSGTPQSFTCVPCEMGGGEWMSDSSLSVVSPARSNSRLYLGGKTWKLHCWRFQEKIFLIQSSF